MIEKIVTIGAYGYDADRFFAALQGAGVDTFCDVRRRRGVALLAALVGKPHRTCVKIRHRRSPRRFDFDGNFRKCCPSDCRAWLS